jgi:TrmH family RNA methyltransferase
MAEQITSKDNPWLKNLRRLAQDNQAYRKMGQVWLEGEHLVDAVVRQGTPVLTLVVAESHWATLPSAWQPLGQRQVVLPDALFKTISGLESPAGLGVLIALPATPAMDVGAPTVVLDRVQDAGNVGSILRSAAALGFQQVLAISTTAALWSPKVLRAGMGAHLALQLHEGLKPHDLHALKVPLLATSSHQGPHLHDWVRQRQLPHPAAWIMGHEGQGVGEELMAMAQHKVRIAQPGGQESLNVAAAAAICLHASATAAL